MQREITEPTSLLDSRGHVLRPGYARRMLYRYNRENVRAHPLALKEWDFYQILQGDWVLQLTIGHVSYAASVSASAFNIRTGQRAGFSHLSPLPLRAMPMPRDPEGNGVLSVAGRDYAARFEVAGRARRLVMKARDRKSGCDIDIDVVLNNDPANEKMVIATPFAKPNQFYLNYKENFWGGEGRATFGDVTLAFDETAAALIDWGRGVWPFTQEWFWGNCTARLDGRRFGFNIGWGFGDTSRATENMFFYDGRAYKLGALSVERDPADYMKPWRFVDGGGAFDVTMTPVFDNFSQTKILFIETGCHQVWGLYSGTAGLPDGRVLVLKDVPAFCEHARNRW